MQTNLHRVGKRGHTAECHKKQLGRGVFQQLTLAGVECMTQVTEYAQHGQEVVANLSLDDLEGIDGILAASPPLLPQASRASDLCIQPLSRLPYLASSQQVVHLPLGFSLLAKII